MPSILRHEGPDEGSKSSREFDRKQVLKNTELNAKLGSEGERVREQLRHARSPDDEPGLESSSPPKKTFPKTKAPGALKKEDVGFDEENLEDWNAHRGQTEKIMEPNTPYMGTAADTEYYDEDPVPDLDLGGSA